MPRQEALNKIKELKDHISNINTQPIIEMVEVKNLTSIPFAIGKYQVTQEQWQKVMGTNPSHFEGKDLPVENVSWNDCQQFIQKLNTITGRTFKLPTEHEWLICASIDGTMYSGSNNLNEVGWYYENSKLKTHPVGQKKPNSLGIYDMSGNVSEWCSDLYYNNNSNCRVLRGGSWGNAPENCQTANRFRYYPDFAFNYFGFRLAMTLN